MLCLRVALIFTLPIHYFCWKRLFVICRCVCPKSTQSKECLFYLFAMQTMLQETVWHKADQTVLSQVLRLHRISPTLATHPHSSWMVSVGRPNLRRADPPPPPAALRPRKPPYGWDVRTEAFTFILRCCPGDVVCTASN